MRKTVAFCSVIHPLGIARYGLSKLSSLMLEGWRWLEMLNDIVTSVIHMEGSRMHCNICGSSFERYGMMPGNSKGPCCLRVRRREHMAPMVDHMTMIAL
jgi:hypothetical protein